MITGASPDACLLLAIAMSFIGGSSLWAWKWPIARRAPLPVDTEQVEQRAKTFSLCSQAGQDQRCTMLECGRDLRGLCAGAWSTPPLPMLAEAASLAEGMAGRTSRERDRILEISAAILAARLLSIDILYGYGVFAMLWTLWRRPRLQCFLCFRHQFFRGSGFEEWRSHQRPRRRYWTARLRGLVKHT